MTTRSVPLLLAVHECVSQRATSPANGGSPVIWPKVVDALARLQPDAGWTDSTARKAYRNVRGLGPAERRNLIETVGEPYEVAVDAVMGVGVLVPVQVTAHQEDPTPEEEEGPEMFPPQLVSGVSLEEKGDIIFEDRRPQPSGDDVDTLLAAYLAVMDASKPFKTAQREARVTLKGNLPIGMSFFGDQHTGGWGWAARRMLEDYKLVAETEGLYMNLLGDDWDNFIFNFAKWASVMPPDHQRRITERLMEGLKPKVVSAVIGNHLHWTKKSADFDMAARLAWIADAVFLGHRGHLHVTVGSQTYHHYLAHRAQGPSVINKSNSGRRTADDIGGAAVIVEADRHDPWLHQEYRARKRQTWLRTGTYKVEDDYPDELGFPQGKWDMPCVILMPDTQRVIPFLNFRDGVDTLEFLRTKYQRGRIISA